jgi:hypothetical protein
MSWSLVQRSPTECGVSNVCDREASVMRRPWPTRVVEPLEEEEEERQSCPCA